VCAPVMSMVAAGWDAGVQDGRGQDANAEDASVVVVAPDGARGADTRYEDAIGQGGSTGLAGAGGAGAGGAGGAGGAATATTTTGGTTGAGAGGATGAGGDKSTGGTSAASGGVTGTSGAGGASVPAGGKDAGSSTQAGRAQGCSCRLSARSEPSGWMVLAFVGLLSVRCLRRLRRSC
jgi:hypothetical protein